MSLHGLNHSLLSLIYEDLMKTLSHNLEFELFKSLVVFHSFSCILDIFPSLPSIFSHPLTNPQFSPINHSSISSPSHTPITSFPVLILLLLLSFHHSSSSPPLFSLATSNDQEGYLKNFPNNITLVNNLLQGILIPLILCDKSSFNKISNS